MLTLKDTGLLNASEGISVYFIGTRFEHAEIAFIPDRIQVVPELVESADDAWKYPNNEMLFELLKKGIIFDYNGLAIFWDCIASSEAIGAIFNLLGRDKISKDGNWRKAEFVYHVAIMKILVNAFFENGLNFGAQGKDLSRLLLHVDESELLHMQHFVSQSSIKMAYFRWCHGM